MNPFSLEGRTALVTGGSRGLGRSIALGLAEAGADVVVVGRDLGAAERAAGEIRDRGRRAWAFSCHVGRWAEVEALVEELDRHTPGIDVLVNNAGKSPAYDSLGAIGERLYDSVLDVNLKGAFRLAVLLGERMVARGHGSIIQISSLSSVRPDAVALPYSMAKAALNAMTLGLSAAFGPAVRVNTIAPGGFETDVTAHWPADVRQRLEEQAALHRLGRPEEVAGAAVYLASDAASYTTGAYLTVDGGVGGNPH